MRLYRHYGDYCIRCRIGGLPTIALQNSGLHHRRWRSNNFDAWLAREASAFLAILASITNAF